MQGDDHHSHDQYSTRTFQFFPFLPAELRLQIWQDAVQSACAYGRVHRLRYGLPQDHHDVPGVIKIIKNQHKTDLELELELGPEPFLEPTPSLSLSTYAIRVLFSAGRESRASALSSLPDSIPLGPVGKKGGILRCNLARDVILLEGITTGTDGGHGGVLFERQLRGNDGVHYGRGVFKSLREMQHLGLDFFQGHSDGDQSPDAEDIKDGEDGARDDATDPPPMICIPDPQTEATFTNFAASFPCLRQIYLFQSLPVLLDSASFAQTYGEHRSSTWHFFSNDDGESEIGNRNENSEGRTREWHTTRHPSDSYTPTREYKRRIDALSRVLRDLRCALDAPPVVTDKTMKEMKRLAGVKMRILRRYGTGWTQNSGTSRGLGSTRRCSE